MNQLRLFTASLLSLLYNGTACTDGCTETGTGEWIQSEEVACPVFCDGGTRTMHYECRNQDKLNCQFLSA